VRLRRPVRREAVLDRLRHSVHELIDIKGFRENSYSGSGCKRSATPA